MPAEQARRIAHETLGKVAAGEDPAVIELRWDRVDLEAMTLTVTEGYASDRTMQ